MANILSVAQSALTAAQVGLTTTGHNIANVNTPGYNRQVVTQATATSQDVGFGFIGKGTTVASVERVYDEYLASRVLSSQSSATELNSYYSQIKQINNMLADSTVGLSPSLQEFFKGVQAVASDSSSGPARTAMLSTAETLASQFNTMDGQLRDLRDGVNSQISSSIQSINGYASQIAKLNDAIEKAQGGDDSAPANDLLDQRDQVISDLSKEIKVSVVKQGGTYNVFIGNGQPLVVNTATFDLVPVQSPTDLSKLQVGYQKNGQTVTLSESTIAGGKLGGLFDFRSQTLDPAQNALGRVAIGLAATFNAQHRMGQDQAGNIGGAFFTEASPLVKSHTGNKGTAEIQAAITDAGALTTSDYQVTWDGTASKYNIMRLSDGQITSSALPVTVDGVLFNTTATSGAPQTGDSFLVRPTVNGAADFRVALTDKSQIAAGMPVRISAGSMVGGIIVNNNAGKGSVSSVTIDATTVMQNGKSLTYAAAVAPATTGTLAGFPSDQAISVTSGGVTTNYPAGTASVPYALNDTVRFGGVQVSGIPETPGSYTIGPPASTLTYSSAAGGTLSGFPANVDVTVTTAAGSTTYAAGTAVPYAAGATISFAGISMVMSGTPADGDKFTVARNMNGTGDNRNALLLAGLQSRSTLDNGTATYQGAYAQLVSRVGNKAHELEVTSAAESKLMAQMQELQQADSGVNLDEEATNLLRYQQAYIAAGKVMQTASKLFDVLLSLGQ